MTPLMLEGPDVLILLAIVVLLFGGAKLAGLGKSAGRALREFKEETRGLSQSDKQADQPPADQARPATTPQTAKQIAAPAPRRVQDSGLTRASATASPASSAPATIPTPAATPSSTPAATPHPAGQSHA